MENTVCRAITLYSYHIPVRTGRMSAQYSTLGFFDGMSTELLQVDYMSDDLSKLWNYIMEQNKKCNGSYSFQNIFVMADDEWNEGYTDREMWDVNTDREYPLAVIVFLQLKEYMVGEDNIQKQCMKFTRKAMECLDDGKVYTYCSVDKNDFVVCIKCKNYHNAVKTIKELHSTGKKIVYSYSVFSVNHEVLENLSPQRYGFLFDEIIESICLKGITNSSGEQGDKWDNKYYAFCEKLAEKLYTKEDRAERIVNSRGEIENKTKDRIYDILGDNDFRYIAREVNLGRLLGEFRKDGILSYQNEEFASFLFSSSLVLNTQTPEGEPLESRNVELNSNEECDIAEGILKEIDQIIRDKEIKNDQVWSVYYALHQLLQSFKVLEISPAKRYDFFSMFHPFKLLLEIVKEKLEEGKIECFNENEDMFDFIYKISTVFHSAQRTDIQFFQIQDFNVIVHYSPAKLRAFYALWVLKLSELYKALKTRKNKKYSFIFSPGMFDNTLVRQLFPDGSEKKRLMLVTLPDNSIYKIKWLPIILSHEAAHIGCERKRLSRHKAVLKVCIRVVLLEIHAFFSYGCCRERELSTEDVVVRTIHNKRDLLTDLCDVLWEKNKEILAEMDEEMQDDECRRDKSIGHIYESFDYMYKYYHEDIIAKYCYSMKNICTGIGDRKLSQKYNELQYDLRYFLRLFITDELGTILDAIYYIEEEAYADLITTLTLEYSMEDYLKFCAYVETTEKDETIIPQGEAVNVRMALVIETACRIAEHEWVIANSPCFAGKWRRDRLLSLCEKFPEESKEQKLAAKVYYYMEKLRDILENVSDYCRLYNPEENCFSGQYCDFLNDKEVWWLLCEYLYECAEEYINKVAEDNDIRKMQRYCAGTYARLRSDFFIDVIQVIEEFLCKNANKSVLVGLKNE